MVPRRLACLALVLVLGSAALAGGEESPKPVRIATGVTGHIHPAVCVTKKGTIVVIFSQSNFKDLRLSRSSDGGLTWSEPVPASPTEKLSIYPGSLTTLSDGRIVHAWNTWYTDAKEAKN